MDFPRSSVIESADYNPGECTLDLNFRSGRRYTYFNVPEQIFDALIVASSAGEYFNTYIRDHYSSSERI